MDRRTVCRVHRDAITGRAHFGLDRLKTQVLASGTRWASFEGLSGSLRSYPEQCQPSESAFKSYTFIAKLVKFTGDRGVDPGTARQSAGMKCGPQAVALRKWSGSGDEGLPTVRKGCDFWSWKGFNVAVETMSRIRVECKVATHMLT